MFCPKCGSEYRPEFTRCAECDVYLVAEPPELAEAEPEYVKYAEVLSTYSPGDVAIIKSVLDGEGITYFFQGQSAAPFLNYAIPMNLLVKKDEVPTAVEVLKDIEISVTYSGLFKKEEPRRC
jgi:hypothetical protein